MFLWCTPQQHIQPFYSFELIKVFINFLLNTLYLLGSINIISVFCNLERFCFNNWQWWFFHFYLKLCKLFNYFICHFDSLVLLCSRGINYLSIMNTYNVALLKDFIRLSWLYDKGSATVSSFCPVVVFYDSFAINLNSFTIPFTWTTRFSFVDLEHSSHCILDPVICQFNLSSFLVNLFFEKQ